MATQQPPAPEPRAESPPLPAPHTAAAPGPRAARLLALYESSLAATLGRVGWDNFAACYPTAAASAPAALRTVQKAVVERLGTLCRKEFEAIVQARAVVPRLNELEGLFSDAARRREEGGAPPVPPHQLPADAVLAAHEAPHAAAQQAALGAALAAQRATNAALHAEVAAQRREAEDLLAALEAAVRDAEGAAELLEREAAGVAAETRAVEGEMMAIDKT